RLSRKNKGCGVQGEAAPRSEATRIRLLHSPGRLSLAEGETQPKTKEERTKERVLERRSSEEQGGHRGSPACTGAGHAPGGRFLRGGLRKAPDRCGVLVERGHALQLRP